MKIGDKVKIQLDIDDEALPDTSMDGKEAVVTGFAGDRYHGILVMVEGDGFRAGLYPREVIPC